MTADRITTVPTTSENLIETIRQQGQPISLYRQRPTREDNLQHVVPPPANPVWLHLREMVVPAPVQRQSPSKPAIQPKSRAGKRKKQSAGIRFMGQEEHRCPYCLQTGGYRRYENCSCLSGMQCTSPSQLLGNYRRLPGAASNPVIDLVRRVLEELCRISL